VSGCAPCDANQDDPGSHQEHGAGLPQREFGVVLVLRGLDIPELRGPPFRGEPVQSVKRPPLLGVADGVEARDRRGLPHEVRVQEARGRAVRTVAKYREELRIPSSSLRRTDAPTAAAEPEPVAVGAGETSGVRPSGEEAP
jgi:hypothetical protein